MISVSRTGEGLPYYLNEGWVEIGGDDNRVDLVHPDRVCLHPMRNGKCLLDKDHKSKRHTTVIFYCECCGRARPGQPYRTQNVLLGDGSIDDTFHFCFTCVKENENQPYWNRIH